MHRDGPPAPAGPATPETTSPEQAADEPRRGFLRRGLGAMAALGFAACGAAAGLWTAATARMLAPNVINQPPQRVRVGRPEQYPAGHVETRFKDTLGLWIVHGRYRGKPQIYALDTTCTHLGCITQWDDGQQRFNCPCHGSAFGRDGINLFGPAPRPLPRYAIRLAEDGQLEVDRSRRFRQERGEWEDPECFVLV